MIDAEFTRPGAVAVVEKFQRYHPWATIVGRLRQPEPSRREPAREKQPRAHMPRYAPRDDGGAVYSEDEDAEQHLTMGPSGDCVTYAKLWHTPMLVGLSALSIPIWRCEELLSTLYDRIQDALTDDGDHDDDESEITEFYRTLSAMRP